MATTQEPVQTIAVLLSLDQLRQSQLENPDLKTVIDWVEASKDPSEAELRPASPTALVDE